MTRLTQVNKTFLPFQRCICTLIAQFMSSLPPSFEDTNGFYKKWQTYVSKGLNGDSNFNKTKVITGVKNAYEYAVLLNACPHLPEYVSLFIDHSSKRAQFTYVRWASTPSTAPPTATPETHIEISAPTNPEPVIIDEPHDEPQLPFCEFRFKHAQKQMSFPIMILESSFEKTKQWDQFCTLLNQKCLHHGMYNLDDAIMELKRFLILKTAANDVDAALLSPSPIVDEMWHCLVLCTRQYAAICKALFSFSSAEMNCSSSNNTEKFLHHNLLAIVDDDEGRITRYSNTVTVYQRAFNKIPAKEYWPTVDAASILHQNPQQDNEESSTKQGTELNHEGGNDTELNTEVGSPQSSNAKIRLAFRLQDGTQLESRVFLNSRFEKVFSAVSKRLGVENSSLRFFFRGERITGEHKPAHFDMEDGDELDVFKEQVGC
eukprot:CAMPEP_0172431140 /NCGR_PEP_ID=MMETSP1064-20121228/57329_1 /TAXON_ID=202472 /ORGANISM="Aulacoseira subarctica , Strain CCAP 1002/5" /LENGTH=430 /DNA_ID=CAMNT_0013177641 /DNA_START=32 /DNA_END=1324 /DNA_ORIENTATION=+